jgi:hypothetical protein
MWTLILYSDRVFQSHFGNLRHECLFIHHVILAKGSRYDDINKSVSSSEDTTQDMIKDYVVTIIFCRYLKR